MCCLSSLSSFFFVRGQGFILVRLGLRPHLTKIKPWPGQMPCLGKHNIPKVAPLTKKQISLDKLLEHTSECQSLDKIHEKPDKVIKPLTFLMSTVVFLMRARSDPIKYHDVSTVCKADATKQEQMFLAAG